MQIRFYLCWALLLAFATNGNSQAIAREIPNRKSPDSIIGFWEYRPAGYGRQKHPLIIYLHGIGERGNGRSDLSLLRAQAIPALFTKKNALSVKANGKQWDFVVLAPQLSRQFGAWPVWYVEEMIRWAKNSLNIDTNRIYLTGISLGGGGVWAAITDSYELTKQIAAAAPVCGTQETNDARFETTLVAAHLPVWAFHCADDRTVPVGMTRHAQILGEMKKLQPVMKITYYKSGGHGGAWVNAYDTGHITRVDETGKPFTARPNLYEWFLLQSADNNQRAARTDNPKKEMTSH